MRCFAVSALAAMSIAAPGPALSAQEGDAVVLVAKRQFRHPLYGASILLAKPIGRGQHIGFILNKPTSIKLHGAWAEDDPARKVLHPLYLGGPFGLNTIFTLVKRTDSPGRDSIRLADGLYLPTDPSTAQRIVAGEPEHVRLFYGAVVWSPGELDTELQRGLWHVRELKAEVVMRKDTAGLWAELVRISEQEAQFRSHGI